MSRPLPLEIQFFILQFVSVIRDDFHLDKDLARHALSSCSLVCKSWFEECRRYLMKNVRISSRPRAETFISTLFSPRGSLLYLHTTTDLDLCDSKVTEDETPFHHIAIHYLSPKLSSLDTLTVSGPSAATKQPRDLPFPPSLPNSLRHFRNLKFLSLENFHFGSFWDLRRFIVSPPALVHLTLRSVTWPVIPHNVGGIPSLLRTSSSLSEAQITDCTSNWDVLWAWATTVPHSSAGSDLRTSKLCEPNESFPGLTVVDVTTIRDIVRNFVGSTQTCTLRWTPSKEQNLYCAVSFVAEIALNSTHDRFSNTGNLHCSCDESASTMNFGMSANVPRVRASARSGQWIACLRTMSYFVGPRDAPQSTHWGTKMDALASRLEKLSELVVDFGINTILWEGIEEPAVLRSQFRQLAEAMSQLRSRPQFSLLFIVGTEHISWEQLKGQSIFLLKITLTSYA
ncbi:hypothetical protein NLI96_g1312 [Meripilus lineatus]|uniref:F-box domain-containing protein n=1 Tax=Meripilus lineatus TaxID=2056292 RepID=A0AAD5VAT7_9APHY|nr:hypothetical protein NLI96_g1312 [Physisporinus lineatus]